MDFSSIDQSIEQDKKTSKFFTKVNMERISNLAISVAASFGLDKLKSVMNATIKYWLLSKNNLSEEVKITEKDFEMARINFIIILENALFQSDNAEFDTYEFIKKELLKILTNHGSLIFTNEITDSDLFNKKDIPKIKLLVKKNQFYNYLENLCKL